MTLRLSWWEPGGVTVVDELEVPQFTSRGNTPGKAQAASRASGDTRARQLSIGETDRSENIGHIHIPVGAMIDTAGGLIIREGWECVVETITPGVDDSALLGRRYRVAAPPPVKSRLTARRLDVVEVPQ